MSLILEALRKSEAERRRGQVPGLHAEPTPPLQPMRQALPPWWWPLLALVAVAVLAVALWLVLRPRTTSDPADTPAVARRTASAADSVGGDATAPRHVTEEIPAGPGAAAPSDSLGDTRGPLARSDDPRGAVADVPDAAASATPAGASPRSAAVAATNPAADAAMPARGDAPAGMPAATPPPMAAPPAAPLAPAPAAATATPARPPPLHLSDLDSAQRQQLPPLRMSMHMWAPTQRFAIIDGNRVSEGDRVGEAVVAEITATGVVLDWQGLRLQVPVR